MGTEVVNLDAFRTAKPAAVFAGKLNPQEESLSDGIGSSYGIIGYKGKTWTLRHRGETHPFLRPDDGSPTAYVDVIVLRHAKAKSKSFYPEGFDAQGSAGKPPTCASIDGVRPDAGVAVAQSELCQLCPRNAWKTDANGRKGRDCTDYKRLAVLLMPSMTQPMLGQALLEPVFLRVPPASLQDLALIGDQMNALGFHYASYVMRISFDPTQSYPKFVFKPLQGLNEAEGAVVLKLRDDQIALRITGEDQQPAVQTARVATVQAPSIVLAPPQPTGLGPAAQQPVVQAQPQVTPGPAVVHPPNGSVLELHANPPATVAVTAGGDTGLAAAFAGVGGGTVTPPPPNAPEAFGQTAEDVGQTDPNLDDRIANLLKTTA